MEPAKEPSSLVDPVQRLPADAEQLVVEVVMPQARVLASVLLNRKEDSVADKTTSSIESSGAEMVPYMLSLGRVSMLPDRQDWKQQFFFRGKSLSGLEIAAQYCQLACCELIVNALKPSATPAELSTSVKQALARLVEIPHSKRQFVMDYDSVKTFLERELTVCT